MCLLSVHAQSLLNDPAYIASLTRPTAVSAVAFYPTNVANTVAFWNYNDAPPGASTWTDEVSHVVLNQWTPNYNAVTNTRLGRYFQDGGMTNASLNTGTNFSFWIVMATLIDRGGQVYGNMGPSGNQTPNNIFFDASTHSPSNLLVGRWSEVNNTWGGHWFGAIVNGGTETNPPLWADIVDSQGSIYLNGASTTGNIGMPSSNMLWQAMGNDLNNSGGGFSGYIKYLLISTNHAITATEASNLWVWEQTNGVTNVSNGLVAWYKMSEGSGSTVADSSGNGYALNLFGSPKPLWTNGLNSVVKYGLAFDGSQNIAVADIGASQFTTSHQITISAWILYTNITEQGGFVSVADTTNTAYTNIAIIFPDPGATDFPLRAAVQGGSDSTYIEDNPIYCSDAAWHHTVYETDGTNQTFWIDGVNTAVLNNTINLGPATGWWNNLKYICVGGANNTGFMQCSVTDVRIYNRFLNDGEVDILYRSPNADLMQGVYNN